MVSAAAWAEGMAQLVACCSDRDLSPGMLRLRGDSYHRDLGGLTDERWLYAVSVARRRRWFPAIDELLEYAAEAPMPASMAALPEESSLSREGARSAAQRGLALVEQALRSRGIEVRSIAHEMPEPDEAARREELVRQARVIAGQEPAEEV